MISARQLVGRTIVRFDPGSGRVGDNENKGRRTLHSPRIELDDGTILYFIVEEAPDGSEPGVFVGAITKESWPKVPR